jgi:tetratricopeptide (TPR) repeat protein/glycosyltransferase involved in cell wall biosynthesis
MTHPTKTLISFATAWGTKFGGINAFNADLLRAVAAAFFEHLRTVCVVLTATDADEQDAKNSNVFLINLSASDTKNFRADLEPRVWELLQQKLPLDEQHTIDTVWLGHDRITGAIALKAAQCRGGKAALIHHMSYAHYEAHAENSAIAHEKENEQKSLFTQATYRIGIGPLLKNALNDLVDKNDAAELIPGLADIVPRTQATRKFNVFMSGRLSDDAKKIKQAHLGLAGFGHAVALCDADVQYPDALKGKNSPQMKLRGVAFENMPDNRSAQDAEQDIKRFVAEHAKRALSPSLLPFTQDRERLLDELRNASAALMPSWHEGFGLVAWEAIAAGVPLVLSQNSGVYQLLDGIHNRMFTPLVQGLDLQGQVDDPFFTDADKTKVAQAIITIARSPETWRTNSARLREELLKDYTWASCAMNFVAAIGWQLPMPQATAQSPTEQSDPQTTDQPVPPQSSPISGLEYPKKQWLAGHGYALSLLLRAEEGIVPFDANRQSYLQQQIDWANQTPWPLGIRLLTGQGGTGKTRLALELCQQLANQGWQMGFLPGKTTQPALHGIAAQLINHASQGTACCVVVDYAETQQQALLLLLGELLKQLKSTGRIRFLLLARDGGEWWSQLPHQQSACESLLLGDATSGPYEIPPLHQDDQTRLAAYQVALSCFANELNLARPTSSPNLEAAHFGHPLHVQMAALLALHGEAHRTADSLPRALIGHERRYWAKAIPEPTNKDSAIILMTLATMAGGFASARDVEHLLKESGLPSADLKLVWKSLAPLYPGEQGLQGLRPDLLGESLVAQSLLDAVGQALISALLGSCSNSAWRLSTLTVLARVLRSRDDVAQPIEAALRQQLLSCAHELCTVGVATPSPLIDLAVKSFRSAPPNQQSQLAGILEKMFEHDALPLSQLDVAVSEFICEKQDRIHKRRPEIKHRSNLAGSIRNLSIAYLRNGQREQALQKASQANEIQQQLAELDPARFEPDWAMSLINYANRLNDTGQHDQALAMAQKSLEIYERLAQQTPDRFEPDWAMSLNNCALILAEVRQHDRALKLHQKGGEISKRLALHTPERFEPDWATSLHNCANCMGDMGQHNQALEMAQQAMEIYLRLAKQKPERFEPNLAGTLSNVAVRLGNMGQHEYAVEMALKALKIYKRLAEHKPERFEPNLATALNNCANCLGDIGQHDQAIAMNQQALEIYQRLASRLPKVYGIEAHNCAMTIALRRWIDTGNDMAYVLTQDVPEGYTHQLLDLQFIGTAMHVLRQHDASEKQFQISFDDFKNAWLALDSYQQNSNESLFHLCASLAVHRLGADEAPEGWPAHWQAYSVRMKHGLPQWMVQGISRCGASFPSP